MVLGGGEGSLWAVPPAGVQEAEFLLGQSWSINAFLCNGKTVFMNSKM